MSLGNIGFRLAFSFAAVLVVTAAFAQAVIPVSLVSLLATPELFHEKEVRVEGALKDDGGLRLYLTNEHAEAGDVASSLRLEFGPELDKAMVANCVGHFAEVFGRFKMQAGAPHELTNVRKITTLHPLQFCKPHDPETGTPKESHEVSTIRREH